MGSLLMASIASAKGFVSGVMRAASWSRALRPKPPKIPYWSPHTRDSARHWARTGQARQTRFASWPLLPSGRKNMSGPTVAHAASARQE